MEDQSRPVTGYPAPGYPPAQSATNARPNGYPYQAPPPPQPQPQYYNPYNAPQYSNQRAAFIRRVCSIMIGLLVIFLSIIFIMWLVIRPRVPEFRVDSVSVSNFIVNSSRVSGNWDFQFSVRNPNKKMKISYEGIKSSLFYKSSFLSETALPPFYQGTRDLTTLKASFAAREGYVDPSIVNDINGDKTRGTVDFNLSVLARVRFSAGALHQARRRWMKVLCEDIKVGVSSNGSAGKLLGGTRECRVGL